MAGAIVLPEVLVRQQRAGALFNTFTTAKRIINDEDVFTFPPNTFRVGVAFEFYIKGGLSNVASSPGNVFFQFMMGSVIAYTTGNLAFNASARTLLPFTLKGTLRVDSIGPTTTAKFLGMGEFGGIHLTNTDQTIQVPTTAPAVGTGFDSTAQQAAEVWAGFSNSQSGNGVQLYDYQLTQTQF